ncbi:MAG: lysylphosphatidylglycerol synthase domain-containing protein [Acidobacteriaceae bacterium]|nr:lysylphosphatidylglycerol synthase domain-containing protein [Acidobacteriaceae bacterium]
MMMDPLQLALFATALLLLLGGHIVRASRLTALFPPGRVNRFDLLVALGFGYAVNTLVPFRLGELVRMLYMGKRCQVRYAYVAATIVAERLSDAVSIGMLGLLLYALHLLPGDLVTAAAALIGFSVMAILCAVLIKRSSTLRHGLWKLASVFNTQISFALLDLLWSTSEIITGRLMLRARFILLTAIMWLIYGASYFSFSLAAHQPLSSVTYEMLGRPLHSMAQRATSLHLTGGELLSLAYSILPVGMILVFGILRAQSGLVRTVIALSRGRLSTWEATPSLVSEHFKEESEYEYFLTSLFAGRDQKVTGFGLRAIEDGIVHRLFHGGSGAITALVEADRTLMIRKFTIGEMRHKLKLQVDWLQRFQHELPLVQVLRDRMESSFYRYDMPYPPQADDFYDVIHTAPLERSRTILSDVVAVVHDFHQRKSLGEADEATISEYLERKVIENARTTLQFVRDLIPGPTYQLNNQTYSLEDWEHLLDTAWLRAQIRDRRIASIHGDLTIENIIVSPTHARGWYIIDPNPGNLFESPLIDWAKLMQSLHLGYEGLNRAGSSVWKGNQLYLSLTRSHIYNELHDAYSSVLREMLGPDAAREVAFHELVNYLRLVPYKISQSQAKGLTFFACTSILLREYLAQYNEV